MRAARERARSFCSAVTRATRTPRSGCTSKRVTVGPVWAATTLARTLKAARVSSIRRMRAVLSIGVALTSTGTGSRRSIEGCSQVVSSSMSSGSSVGSTAAGSRSTDAGSAALARLPLVADGGTSTVGAGAGGAAWEAATVETETTSASRIID